MLSWASYLFGGASTEPQQDESNTQEETPMDTAANNEKDWVVVEHADCCFRTKPSDHQSYVTCYPGNSSHGDATDCGSHHTNGELCKQNSGSSSTSTSPSKHSTPGSLSPVSHSRTLYVRTNQGRSNEAWLLTPPSCFTAGDSQAPQVGITDLENLLIEHPSMSVYKRSGSAGEDSNESESSDEQGASSNRSHAVSRQAPKRVRTVSARAQLLSQVSQIKHAQKVQQKKTAKSSGRKTLKRANMVATFEKKSPQNNRTRNPSGRMSSRVPQRKN